MAKKPPRSTFKNRKKERLGKPSAGDAKRGKFRGGGRA